MAESRRKSSSMQSVLDWVRNPPSFNFFTKKSRSSNKQTRDFDKNGGEGSIDTGREGRRETRVGGDRDFADYYGYQTLPPHTSTGVRRREAERDDDDYATNTTLDEGGHYKSTNKRTRYSHVLSPSSSSPFGLALARSNATRARAIDGRARYEYVTSPPRSPPDHFPTSPHGNAASRRLSLSGRPINFSLNGYNSFLATPAAAPAFAHSPYASPYSPRIGASPQPRYFSHGKVEDEESRVYSNVARRSYRSANASHLHLMEKRGPSFSPPPASPTQFRYGNHSVGVGGGYAPSPKEEKLLDLEEAAKAKVQQAELLYNKAIQAAKIAIESRTGVTGGSSGSGSHINMSSSPREDYEKRKAFMKPEQLTLDIASLSSYKKLIETVNSIEEEPFAASPLKERKQPAAAEEEQEQGWVNKNTNKDGQGQKNLKGKDVIDSSTTSVVKKAASKPVTLLQLKIQKIIGKKSLEDAEQKERQIEIDSLHSRLDTLELTRVKGDTDAVDALLLSQKEEVEEEEERVIIKPLSPESNEHYRRIMSTSHNDVICQHKSLRLSVSDMHSLGPGQWLTDENINFYMALLNDRAQRRIKEGRGPACYFTNTFFFNKLYKNSRRYEYKGVRKWTKKVKIGVSTAECDKIIVPIHQQVHWCCAVVDIKRKELVYYDSMLGRDESVLESLAQWVQDEMKDKADLTIDTSTWERRYPGNIPQQENGYDCGVFAVKFAEYSGLDAPLDFSQKNMSHFRKEMVVQLSKVNLDYEE